MKHRKRFLALSTALLLTVIMTPAVSAEKFVDTLTDTQKSADAPLADEYRAFFSYQSISMEGSETVMDYRLYVPEDYDASKAYPVILFLHGAGESNNGSNTNEAQLNVGMMNDFFTRGYYEKFPCLIVAPQVPKSPSGSTGEWVNVSWKSGSYEIASMDETCGTFTENIQLAKAAVDKTIADYNVDTDRIYVTGVSMGGYGTWNIITHYSDYFAAAMPICGAGDPSKAEYLMNMPIWCFHGDADVAVPVAGSRDMYEAITALGSTRIHYTEWAGEGHTWTPAYMREDVWQWLFSQAKTTVDVTELAAKLNELKTIDLKRLSEEDKIQVEVAISCCQTVINDAVHTEAMVREATKLADAALLLTPISTAPPTWLIVTLCVVAMVLIAVLVVVVWKIKRKA